MTAERSRQRQEVLRRMMADAGLSADARLIGWHIYSKGPGEHAVSHDEFACLFHGVPSAETIRRKLRELRVRGYLNQTPRGQGNAPAYEFAPTLDVGSNIDPTKNEGSNSIDPTENEGSIDLTPQNSRGQSAPHVRASPLRVVQEEDEDEEGAGARPETNLHPDAAAELERSADHLAGTAEPLAAYLAARVAPARQAAYVASVVALLRPATVFDWRGTALEQRAEYVADALRDLAASDEARGHSRPAGDFANLRTKLAVLLRPSAPPLAAAAGAGGARRGFAQPRTSLDQRQTYTPTTEFRGFGYD